MKWNKVLLVQPPQPGNQSGSRVVNLFSGGQIDKTCFNAQRSDLTPGMQKQRLDFMWLIHTNESIILALGINQKMGNNGLA